MKNKPQIQSILISTECYTTVIELLQPEIFLLTMQRVLSITHHCVFDPTEQTLTCTSRLSNLDTIKYTIL